MGGVWRFEMLGGCRFLRGSDQAVARFSTRKTAHLLAYLALHPGRDIPREQLAEQFWPDLCRSAQRHSLRMALSELRKHFGPDGFLIANRFTVRLAPEAITTDVADFEQAVACGDADTARALFVGPFLPGVYDDWVVSEQHRLEALREGLDKQEQSGKGLAGQNDSKNAGKNAGGCHFGATLPLTLTAFFGRDAETAALTTALQSGARLVTLVGPGGIGKTRFALQYARAHERAVFVGLADLTRPEQTPEAVARALRLPPPLGVTPQDRVKQALADYAAAGPLLLVLDNAEHLLGGGFLADFVIDLLTVVTGLSVLVASRRALGIPGEVTFPIGPLGIEAQVALFLDRSGNARPGFSASAENRAVAREICQRLEGIPLALELAAARVSVLSGRAVLENVDRRLDFLGLPPKSYQGLCRHRSLRAALRVSYDLLPPRLQTVFAHLSVFRGGFTADAAAEVTGARLDTLDELLRWSLLTTEETEGGALRFRMLETVREFGQECMTDHGARELSRRHVRYFRLWAEMFRFYHEPYPAPDHATRLVRQDAEKDNIRAALAFCRESPCLADREQGLRLVSAFWAYWQWRNGGSELEDWVTGLLTGVEPNPLLRAVSYLALAVALREQGRTAQFSGLADAARSTLVHAGSEHDLRRHIAQSIHLCGLARLDDCRLSEAESDLATAEALWEEQGGWRYVAVARSHQAMVCLKRGDFARAKILCESAQTLLQNGNEPLFQGLALCTLAEALAGRGDGAAAMARCRESIEQYAQIGYARGEADAHRLMAQLWGAQGCRDEATHHAKQACDLYRRAGDRYGEAVALLTLADSLLDCPNASPADNIQAQTCFQDAVVLQEAHGWLSLPPQLESTAARLRQPPQSTGT